MFIEARSRGSLTFTSHRLTYEPLAALLALWYAYACALRIFLSSTCYTLCVHTGNLDFPFDCISWNFATCWFISQNHANWIFMPHKCEHSRYHSMNVICWWKNKWFFRITRCNNLKRSPPNMPRIPWSCATPEYYWLGAIEVTDKFDLKNYLQKRLFLRHCGE